MEHWYAAVTHLSSKDIILSELDKAGYRSKLPLFKDILTFDIKRSYIYMQSEDDSIIRGYAFFRIDEKDIMSVVSALSITKLARFLNRTRCGAPRPVSDEEIELFKHEVLSKGDGFKTGCTVRVISGALEGLEGTVVSKTDTMVEIDINLAKGSIRKSVDILSVRLEE